MIRYTAAISSASTPPPPPKQEMLSPASTITFPIESLTLSKGLPCRITVSLHDERPASPSGTPWTEITRGSKKKDTAITSDSATKQPQKSTHIRFTGADFLHTIQKATTPGQKSATVPMDALAEKSPKPTHRQFTRADLLRTVQKAITSEQESATVSIDAPAGESPKPIHRRFTSADLLHTVQEATTSEQKSAPTTAVSATEEASEGPLIIKEHSLTSGQKRELSTVTPDFFRGRVYFSQNTVSCCIRDDAGKYSPLSNLVKSFKESGFDHSKPPIQIVVMRDDTLITIDNRRALAIYLAASMPEGIPIELIGYNVPLTERELCRFTNTTNVIEAAGRLLPFSTPHSSTSKITTQSRNTSFTYEHAITARINHLRICKITTAAYFNFPHVIPIASENEKMHKQHAENINKKINKY